MKKAKVIIDFIVLEVSEVKFGEDRKNPTTKDFTFKIDREFYKNMCEETYNGLYLRDELKEYIKREVFKETGFTPFSWKSFKTRLGEENECSQ